MPLSASLWMPLLMTKWFHFTACLQTTSEVSLWCPEQSAGSNDNSEGYLFRIDNNEPSEVLVMLSEVAQSARLVLKPIFKDSASGTTSDWLSSDEVILLSKLSSPSFK